MAYITAIETAVPDFVYSQEELRDFYSNSTGNDSYRRKIKIVADRSGINQRHSVLRDFKTLNADFELFGKTAGLPEPPLTPRMQLYKKYALPLAQKAIVKIKNFEEIKDSITHLITVTCTGLFAPGLDIDLMMALKLKPTINRSSVNFMGCNAAIIALKQANDICTANPGSRVLIVCVELCTLHFQKQYNDDYILSNLIFSDGAAAILVDAKPSVSYYGKAVKIKAFNSIVLQNGYNEMAWQLSENGFIMNLTSYVPGLIRENMQAMLTSLSLKTSEIDHWAIHPGGKRILDEFCSAIGLEKSKLSQTYKVLENYGNMSSPTVLFVLKKVLEEDLKSLPGENIFTAAFGPGISIETMQLEYV